MDWFQWKNKKKSSESMSVAEACLYVREDLMRERIIDADFPALVCLPPTIDSREWIAAHTVGFVEHTNLVWGAMSEFCNPSSCPVMSLPSGPLAWTDERGRKLKCSAAEYTDYVLTFCQHCILDEAQFPTKYGNKFPLTFDATLRRIYRLLAHVLSHAYAAHCRHVLALALHGCLNTLAFHFTLFARAHRLADERDLAFLARLADRLHRPLEPEPGEDLEETEKSQSEKSAKGKKLEAAKLEMGNTKGRKKSEISEVEAAGGEKSRIWKTGERQGSQERGSWVGQSTKWGNSPNKKTDFKDTVGSEKKNSERRNFSDQSYTVHK